MYKRDRLLPPGQTTPVAWTAPFVARERKIDKECARDSTARYGRKGEKCWQRRRSARVFGASEPAEDYVEIGKAGHFF